MAYCNRCGKPLAPGMRYCNACGAPVPVNLQAAPPVPPRQSAPSPVPPRQPSAPQQPPRTQSVPPRNAPQPPVPPRQPTNSAAGGGRAAGHGDRYFDPMLGQSTCPHDPLPNTSPSNHNSTPPQRPVQAQPAPPLQPPRQAQPAVPRQAAPPQPPHQPVPPPQPVQTDSFGVGSRGQGAEDYLSSSRDRARPVRPQAPSMPNIPPLTGGMNPMSALQGIFDIKASDMPGAFVASSWQIPTDASSAMQMGMSALNSVSKKYAWAWFLIPAVTIIAFIISKL